MNFLRKIKSSIYDPVFYRQLLDKPLSYSFKYFFSLILVVALISALLVSVTFVPKARDFIKSIGSKVLAEYPENLEVNIKDGLVSTNVAEPYFIKTPESMKESSNVKTNLPDRENIIVIDTKKDLTLGGFDSYNTFILITKDSVVYKDNRGKTTIQSLKGTPDFKLNKTELTNFIEKLNPFIKSIPFIAPILAFIVIFILYTAKLVYLILVAILVFLLMKIKKNKITYKKSYQIAMHAVTLPIIVFWAFVLLGIPYFIFLPTAILLIVVLVNVKDFEAQVSAL